MNLTQVINPVIINNQGISARTGIHTAVLLLLVAAAALTRQYWKDSQMEFWLSSVLIIAAGIPHGALDHFVARHNRKKFDLTVYVFLYIVCAALYLTLWWFAPGIAFLIFLLITAWHFGETDFSCFTDNQGAGLYSFVYGTSITMWLLMQDKPLLFRWTALITGDNQTALSIVSWLAVVPVYTWFLVLGLMLFMVGENRREHLLVKIPFLLFVLCLSQTSLLMGFILYFTGWHSVNALLHIKGSVFRDMDGRLMLEKAMPATLTAVSFLIIMWFMSNGAWLDRFGLPALFILLSILTVPHMIEMHRLYTRRSANT
ncbi:MAG: Brp/Blh family beta-carotene 15,15'-dioxygenase [Bacteroidota bacterium]